MIESGTMSVQILDDDYELERVFGWLLHDTHRLIRRVWGRSLRDAGLEVSEPQARILAFLTRAEGMSQTQLANGLDMEKAPLGRLLDGLEDLGYVCRKPDPEDRRARRVYLTSGGADMIPLLGEVAKGMFDKAMKGVSDSDRETVNRVLSRLKQNLSDSDDIQLP